MFDNTNKPKGINRVILASLNSFRAIKWLYLNESAFRQELLFDISAKEQVFLLLAIVFIIFTEIVNTAIEAVVDRVGLEIHPLSGLAKDLGSAAVFLSLIIASSIWLVILL